MLVQINSLGGVSAAGQRTRYAPPRPYCAYARPARWRAGSRKPLFSALADHLQGPRWRLVAIVHAWGLPWGLRAGRRRMQRVVGNTKR